MITRVLEWLYPKRCVGCGMEGLSWICHQCRSGEEGFPQEVSAGVTALSSFKTPVIRESMHGLKYHSLHDIAEELVEFLWKGGLIEETAVLVPVPTSLSTLKKRGFNQAELFAQAIAKRTGQRVETGLLRKVRKQSLVGLSREERGRAGGFVRSSLALPSEPVVLIDDIRTTGATLDACMSLLGPQAKALVIAQD